MNSSSQAYLSRDDIRDLACCPTCEALKGAPCIHEGKGAQKKTRQGVNHTERMREAQKVDNLMADDPNIVIDHGDKFTIEDIMNLSSQSG